jgi:hypothetical protein
MTRGSTHLPLTLPPSDREMALGGMREAKLFTERLCDEGVFVTTLLANLTVAITKLEG